MLLSLLYLFFFFFNDTATTEIYTLSLHDALPISGVASSKATPDIEVRQKRSDDRTQDFGATLVLILGAPAVVVVAKALGDWLKLRNSAKITIKKDGQVVAENLTSNDALKLAELLHPQQ